MNMDKIKTYGLAYFLLCTKCEECESTQEKADCVKKTCDCTKHILVWKRKEIHHVIKMSLCVSK